MSAPVRNEKKKPMRCYIVRVYRIQDDHAEQLVGIVERPGNGLPLAFTNVDELWAILTVPKPVGGEPVGPAPPDKHV